MFISCSHTLLGVLNLNTNELTLWYGTPFTGPPHQARKPMECNWVQPWLSVSFTQGGCKVSVSIHLFLVLQFLWSIASKQSSCHLYHYGLLAVCKLVCKRTQPSDSLTDYRGSRKTPALLPAVCVQGCQLPVKSQEILEDVGWGG